MRIGVIFCAFNTREYLADSLAPFLAAREQRLGGHTWVICAVNVAFSGFPIEAEDGTRRALAEMHNDGTLDNLIAGPDNIPETTARGMALGWLKGEGCELVWQADSDEFPTLHDLRQIVEFVDDNPWVAWFRLSLKNYVFDTNTYLIEPFTPARIHRVFSAGLEASAFWADNNVSYQNGTIRDDTLSCLTVPQSAAWVKHLTWMSTDRSRRKVAYHENHFISRPAGVRSSYRWDDVKGLVFNESYYAYVKQPLPKTAIDGASQSC